MTPSKNHTKFSEELFYSLREIYTVQKSIVSDDDIALCNKEHLEICFLKTKVKHVSGVRLSRTIPEKSVILLHELLTQNSHRKNRQIAVIGFLMFLYRHGYWFTMPTHEFKSFIVWLEGSPKSALKKTLEGAREVVLSGIQPLYI